MPLVRDDVEGGLVKGGYSGVSTTPKYRPSTPEEDHRAAPGRKAAKKTPRAQQHADKPITYGKADREANLLRRFQWRVIALRPDFDPELLTTVESVDWTDEAAIMTGNMTVRDPSFGIGQNIELREGDRVRLFMDGGAGFKAIWTMRVYAPSRAVKAGQQTLKLANDLDLLRRSTDDFVFPKDHAHPNGWTGDEMIRDICRRYGVVIGGIPKFKFRRKKSVTYSSRKQGGTGLVGVFLEICNVERQHTGRRYEIRWESDALWITPLTRSPHLLALGPSLLDAAYDSALPSEDPPSTDSFASAITIRSIRDIPAGKDKNGKKISTKTKPWIALESPATRKRYGYVHRAVWSPDADTLGELREHGLQYLALIAKPLRTLTLNHEGMPELRRGDAIRLGIGADALLRQIVWISSLQFSLSPSDFTMSVTCAFDDPYIDKKQQRIDRLLAGTAEAAAATRRGRKPVPVSGKAHTDAQKMGLEQSIDTQLDQSSATPDTGLIFGSHGGTGG